MRNIKGVGRQAMGLLCLTNTELAIYRILAGVDYSMHQQCRLAEEDQQHQGKITAAKLVIQDLKQLLM